MEQQPVSQPHWAMYQRGIELFNRGEFFEAHEAWEELWHLSHGQQYDFIQGLIQAAVALVHYQRSNPRGMASLHQSFHRKLDGVPSPFMRLDVRRFLADMDAFLDPITRMDPLPAKGQVRLERDRAPKIQLEGEVT